MIVPMRKVSCFIYKEDYIDSLNKIKELAVAHIIPSEKEELSATEIDEDLLNKYKNSIKFLKDWKIQNHIILNYTYSKELLEEIIYLKKQLNKLSEQKEKIETILKTYNPWGNISVEEIKELTGHGVNIKLYSCSEKYFNSNWMEEYTIEIISRENNTINFVIFNDFIPESKNLKEVHLPLKSIQTYKTQLESINKKLIELIQKIDFHAYHSISQLNDDKLKLLDKLEYNRICHRNNFILNKTVRLLEVWVPLPYLNKFINLLNKNSIVYIERKAYQDEKVPILLKNNYFNRLFEPILKLFSLPNYFELDLTPFLSPFFLMFFGFCLGDAGYGIIILISITIYKYFASQSIKPILSLAQFLGLGTIIFGLLSGTVFGVNLLNLNNSFLHQYKVYILDSNQLFNFALILGVIQILFGILLKAINKITFYGLKYALNTIGWFLGITTSIIYFNLELLIRIEIYYFLAGTSLFMIIFFNQPGESILKNFFNGLWDIYSTVTGIFGDLLSYIRLFALGLSSSILGFVVNDIAFQIKDSMNIIGPVLFVLFLILGHSINILISSLGSFVHPMRLTFVEFFKNAGFKGGGVEYRPFSKLSQ